MKKFNDLYITVSREHLLEELVGIIRNNRDALLFTNEKIIKELEGYLSRTAKNIKHYHFQIVLPSGETINSNMQILQLGEIDFEYKYRIIEWKNERGQYVTPELAQHVFFISLK